MSLESLAEKIHKMVVEDKIPINDVRKYLEEKGGKNMKLSEWIEKYGDWDITEETEKCIKKPKGKWRPEKGEEYFFINTGGLIVSDYCSNGSTDIYRHDFIRMFKTIAEAERYLEIMKACKEASFEPDWKDIKQSKYYLYYNHYDKSLNINSLHSWNEGLMFYFKSYDDIETLIDRFGEKDIAKYVLGVEE